jgi:predicted MPP superfamily phosphohydrolase
MGLLIILIIVEIFTLIVLKQHFFNRSKAKYILSVIIHIILSIWVWIIFIETTSYNSFYDNPMHVWLMMNMSAVIIAIVIPRILLIILHFSGKLINIKNRTHVRGLTNAGFIIMTCIIAIISISTLYGRFNFKREEVTIKIKGLNKDLDGLKIVQLSDMHLTSFYHHKKLLQKVIDDVNQINPDILINTGDFVSFGWREFERDDTILSMAKSRYGNFAIMGNHDEGTYDPDFTEADRSNNILILNNLIKSSGYQVLNNEFRKIRIGNASVAFIGVTTAGRHPHMVHGDLNSAIKGLDSVDLKILLTHDPNHWTEAVEGKTDIGITFSGHTHGMQMGIITKNFRWSPAKYFYPHWNGLYTSGNQYHYVNRGLGVLAIPFRIWMPPEITVITVKKE